MKKKLSELLVERNLAANEKEAQGLIIAGLVYSGTVRLEKPGAIYKNDIELLVKHKKSFKWVSRAGIKLDHALSHFQIPVPGRIAMDIGCAIGGFTEVLLENNAKKIYSVDVGYGEFAWKLRQDPRVCLLEKTNARFLTPAKIKDPIDLIVCDVSFIGLNLILPPAMKLASKNSHLIALIKPQFEVKKNQIGPKGIVTDPILHQEVIARIRFLIENEIGWKILDVIPSPIKGTEGNTEFLIGARNEFN
jgi:23S rRNA (cytidine1920-2'-O)/16S rRNA (cytidine1409-2'-O)-methyltransferase